MASTQYLYSISADFPNHAVQTTRLTMEIQASTIVTALDRIDTSGDDCGIWFKSALSVGDKTTLDGVVHVHSGAPLPTEVQPVLLSGVPTDDDGKPQMVPNLLPSWTSLYFAGQGDHRTNGLGEGTAFTCTSELGETKTVEWIYTDQVYLVGGSVIFSGAELGDIMDYEVVAPATALGVGSTTVSKVPYGAGHVLVPDPNGNFTIDPTNVGLVPSSGQGYWDWDDPSQGYGTITPNYEGTGGYSLFDFDIVLGHPLVKLHVMGVNKIDFLMSTSPR